MEKNYPEITKGISSNLKVLRKNIADTMQGFSAMAQAATKDGALDKKSLMYAADAMMAYEQFKVKAESAAA